MMTAPVLIVGAGPTGLCASILLSRHGVPSLVIERQPGTASHPNAAGISTRTLELFRSWGMAVGSRNRLEQALLDHARRFRVAEVRYSTELTDLRSHGDGLDVTLANRPTGVSSHGRVRYVIVTDAEGPLRTKPWIPGGRGTAASGRFQIGRVLLAGQAARIATADADDLNIGIGDVHNLAWKIAAVVQGWGGEPLLETYDSERRLAGAPSAGRAPEVWLERGGRMMSTLDLWRERFVLLVSHSPVGEAWAACAYSVARDLAMPFAAFTIGPAGDLRDPEGTWRRTYGVEADGAVLIRPDGQIACRSRRWMSNPIAKLTRTLSHALGRGTTARMLPAAS